MKFCWKCTHPQSIHNVDEFVSSSEQIWWNLSLHHLLTNRSSAVNGCRQNESPNMCLFLTNMQLFISQDINCEWSGVDYLCIIVMFLSAVWTLILKGDSLFWTLILKGEVVA